MPLQLPMAEKTLRLWPRGQIDTKFLVMDHDTVSSPLREGDTTFIIFLARSSTLDRFTFINENKPARGELRIAGRKREAVRRQRQVDVGRRSGAI